jgi:transcriptional regulator with XRE-family HTH domain
MTFDTRAFGADLRAWRKRHKKRIDDITTAVGTCRSHVSRIETGDADRIGVAIALNIARLIGADLDSYLRDTTRSE